MADRAGVKVGDRLVSAGEVEAKDDIRVPVPACVYGKTPEGTALPIVVDATTSG